MKSFHLYGVGGEDHPQNDKDKNLKVGVVVFLVLAALFVIFSDSDPSPKLTVVKSDRCLAVSQETLSWIEEGLIYDDLSLENAQSVKSKDFQSVYFVSARMVGDGLSGDEIATFATINIDSTGLVLAVSGHAKEFTNWFHGDREGGQYHVTLSNDGARESRECIE